MHDAIEGIQLKMVFKHIFGQTDSLLFCVLYNLGLTACASTYSAWKLMCSDNLMLNGAWEQLKQQKRS